MKKLATAILVFELIAGLLFLGLQESRGQIPTAGEAAARAGGSGAAGETDAGVGSSGTAGETDAGVGSSSASGDGDVVVGRNITDGQNSPDSKNSSKGTSDGESAQTEYVTDDENVRKVAITFDDGPHPSYTEQLLDGLKERGVHATFFVTGEHAELHPDIIKRMQEDA